MDRVRFDAAYDATAFDPGQELTLACALPSDASREVISAARFPLLLYATSNSSTAIASIHVSVAYAGTGLVKGGKLKDNDENIMRG